MDTSAVGRPGLSILVALGIATACTLAFQVVLTRFLSAVLAYHFSFLAISLALLGTGGGALLVYVRPAWFRRDPLEAILAHWCGLFALLLIILPFLLVRLDFTYGESAFSYSEAMSVGFVLNLAAACTLAALPSFVAGVLVTVAIDRYARWIGLVYAFDLIGAGAGALLVVPFLWIIDAPTLFVGLGVAAAVAAGLFAGPHRRQRTASVVLAVTGLVGIGLSVATSVLYLPPNYQVPEDAFIVNERWTPLSRVIGYELPGSQYALLFYDRVYAPVPVLKDDALPSWEEIGTATQSIGYAITGPGKALIIGGGGGRDIWTALVSDQLPVDVIELNEGIQRVVDVDLGHLSRSPYSYPGVRTTIGDGRSVLAARDTLYDQIHIGFTDTLSANAAQGFVLAENNLYTLEAFEEYFAHLKPRGILNVSRLLKLVGDEAIRVTVLTLAALERRGIEHPERHVVVVLGRDILGPPFGTVLARLEPFEDTEIEQIRRLATERGDGIAFAPGGPYVGAWKELSEASDYRRFCESYPLNICPPTDDRPFFFAMQRLTGVGSRSEGYAYSADPFSILLLTLGILIVLSGIAFAIPLTLARRVERPGLFALSYFGAIGLGFLLLEIVLIQRFVLFLGFPTYALSVVLFGLLISSGVGSLLSERLGGERRTLLTALAVGCLLIAGFTFGLQPVLRALINLPFALRVVISVAILGPVGMALGMAMPIGLKRFRRLHPTSIPYAWAVNGVTSVVASVLGVAIAIQFGFAVVTLLALGCYLFALVHAALGRWDAVASDSLLSNPSEQNFRTLD